MYTVGVLPNELFSSFFLQLVYLLWRWLYDFLFNSFWIIVLYLLLLLLLCCCCCCRDGGENRTLFFPALSFSHSFFFCWLNSSSEINLKEFKSRQLLKICGRSQSRGKISKEKRDASVAQFIIVMQFPIRKRQRNFNSFFRE